MDFGTVVHVDESGGAPSVMLVCEHATNRVPSFMNGLGLRKDALESHIAWDPGALAVSKRMAEKMSAPLVYGGVSRLIYDCNRPPESPEAMRASSAGQDIPANAALSPEDRRSRVEHVYKPFVRAVSNEIDRHRNTLGVMVTVHSFTPVYLGQERSVELGLLHGQDDRFARAMMATVPSDLQYDTRLNEPYSAADGVAHTLDAKAYPNGLLNVMIEIRNDLIRTPEQQIAAADVLAPWIMRTLAGFENKEAV